MSLDGSLTVADRYLVTGREEREALERFVGEWPGADDAVGTVCKSELSVPPHLVSAGEDRVDVVFQATPGSRHWKDLVIRFVNDVPLDVAGEFEGFVDLVGGVFRPSSRPGQASES